MDSLHSPNLFPSGSLPIRHSEKDNNSYRFIELAYENCLLSTLDKLEAFPRFVSKRSIAKFLCKYEIYKQILHVNGVIIECGVFNGAGLFSWAHLANIFEPVNYNRRILGFDTFEGFPSIDQLDTNNLHCPSIGELKGDQIEQFSDSLQKYNFERHLSHIPNIELIKGDFMLTGENYLKSNPHTLISLLYLDFDLYEPTVKALQLFLPRMPKGAVVCFDQLNCPNFPGETLALLESFDLSNKSIQRFPHDPWLSYIIL